MTRTCFLVGIALIATCLIASAVLYPHLPSQIPTHWNVHGQVDDYGAKRTALVIYPLAMLTLLAIFAAIPWLSPKHFEIDTFRSTYLYIVLAMLAFMTYLHGLTLWAALSGHVNISKAVAGGVYLLVALLGNVMGKVRRNFYVGFRTPWTIADERVWNATHRLGAKTMVVGGLGALLLVFTGVPFWLPLATLLAGAFVPAVYSLIYYKQLERRGELT
jgi:uncharacterized membrane protein